MDRGEMSSLRRTQSSRRASVPNVEPRLSSGRVVPTKQHRASTGGGSQFVLPRIPQANGQSKFWAINEDSTSPGAELPQAAPRAKKDRQNSARSNASSSVSSASAASSARLEKPKAWGGLHAKDFRRAHRQARTTDKGRGLADEPTVEEAISALELRKALEHQAALAHLEELRLEALEAERREVQERHQRQSEDIRLSFAARRRQNVAKMDEQLASASFVPIKPMYGSEDEDGEWDDDEEEDGDGYGVGHGHGRGRVHGDVGGEFTAAFNFKSNARAGVQLPSIVQPNAKKHRRRSKPGSKGAAAAVSHRGGAVAEEKREMAAKIAELDDFDTRVSYFHTSTLKQRLEARGWGGFGGGFGNTNTAEVAKTVEEERPPTVLTNPGYADYFA